MVSLSELHFQEGGIALLISAVLAAPIMAMLHKMKSRQTVSQHLEGHQVKQGTPTMGGLIILVGAIPVVLWNRLWVEATLLIGFALIGFADDYLVPKWMPGKRGLGWVPKLLMQFAIAVLALAGLQSQPTTFSLVLGILTILFFSNAYNFSDGLDGLAGSLGFLLCLGLCLLPGGPVFSSALLPICGGILPFLFLNKPKAKVFMGDVGSLPIGALIGYFTFLHAGADQESLSFITTREFLPVFLLSLVMIAELVPVPLQIFWVKVFKKRLFPFTPIHHAFEKAGWPEVRVTAMFVAVQLLCVIAAVALGKA